MAIKFLSGLNITDVTAGSILKLDSNGNVVAATAGTDYATSSLWSSPNSGTVYTNDKVGIGYSDAGAKLHVYEYQTTTPKILIEDGNTGDASMQFKISAQQFTMGIDNSDSDQFIIAASSAFGTTNAIEIETDGDVIIPNYLSVNSDNASSAPLHVGNVNRGSWNDGIVIDDPTGWAATVYKRSNNPKMFTGLRSGTDNFIWMSPNYSNTNTNLTAPRTDAVLEVNSTNDRIEIYLPTHFGQDIKVYGGDLDLRDPNEEDATNVLYFNANNGASTNDSNDIGTGIVWKPDYTAYSKRSAGIMQIGEGNYFKSGLAFYTNNTSDKTTDWSERMRISKEGNVGIGNR